MLQRPAIACGATLALLAGVAAETAAQTPSRELLDGYCVTCHNARLQTANLALDAVDLERVGEHAEALEKVVRKLRAGQMPPEGRPRPARDDVETFVAALEAALDREAAGHTAPGRVASRRLNRVEYVNAIEDLLGLQVDGAELLPSDMAGFGFDNNAEVLAMTPSLMARYITAATTISRMAVGSPDNRPDGRLYTLGFEQQDERMHEDMPFGTHGGLSARHVFPLDGEYRFSVRMERGLGDTSGRVRGITEDAHDIELRIDHAVVKTWTVGGAFPGALPGLTIADDDVESLRGHEYLMTADHGMDLRIPVEAGQRLVSVAFTDSNPSPVSGVYGRPGIYSLFIAGPYAGTVPDETPRAGRASSSAARQAPRRGRNGMRARDSGHVGAARLPPAADPARHRGAAAVLRGRPAGTRLRLYGIERGLEAILSMPAFLLRAERQPAGVAAGEPYRLSDLELASRLSFFLWRSMPDDGTARRRRGRPPERPGCPRRAGTADAGRPQGRPLHERLCRSVATGAQHQRAVARRRTVRAVQRHAPQGDGHRDGAVLPEPGARRPADPGTSPGRLHLPQRAARRALRHRRRVRQPFPARRARRRPAPRPAGAR